ncbi:MAG: right-handed parallel beta-helix repeat-containing protein [Phycisphaerales bacterium]|nr:right-handed parallel beta-helix repeat-containing protein [Phycisphaerales bacterium]
MSRFLARTLPITLATLACTTLALAGPLSPPVGPVTSTSKPIGEIEPRIAINSTNTPGDNDATPSVFKITQPGSYYLSSSFSVPNATRGIEVAANNVTIDLNGFTITGLAGSINAIAALGGTENVSVINGTVQSLGNVSISLSAVSFGRIENLLVQNGSGDGIRTGPGFIFRNCTAKNNAGYGYFLSSYTSIDSCSAIGNGIDGFNTGLSCSLRNCIAHLNTGAGITGASRSIVTSCTANQNGQGITVSSFSLITNCNSTNNNSIGFGISSNSSILNCNASSNGVTSVAAGILVTGSNVRVEGNNSVGSDTGFEVTGISNIIIRNTASGNTTAWNIVAGNAIGPIVATSASAAVNGSTGASSLNTTDPNANFSY